MRVKGFGVKGLGFRDVGLGLRVEGLGLKGLRVEGSVKKGAFMGAIRSSL